MTHPGHSAGLVLGALALWSCATPGSAESSGDKGGLVAVTRDAAVDRAHDGRKFALVVGIGEFEDAQWRALRYADKDARDLAAALKDPLRGAFDEVTLLQGEEGTSRKALLAALDALQARANRPQDVALVYFSSHGTLARDSRGELRRYLVTRDTRFREVAQTGLAMDALKDALDGMKSKRRLLILASCHSGSGKSLLPDDIAHELAGIKSGFYARPLEEQSKASMVFSASDWGETAREDDQLQNDIYTHFLIEALDGRADRNLDGAVTATEGHDYARRATYAFTQGRQRPSAEILEVGADPVVLAGQLHAGGNPELFSYHARLEGFDLRVDGETKAELPGGASVAPGKRTVQLTKGGEVLLTEELDLIRGERLDVSLLLLRRMARSSVSLVFGGFGFLDGPSRAEILPPSAGLGLAVKFDDAILPRLGLWADGVVGGGKNALRLSGTQIPFTFTSALVGASAPYQWELGPFSLYTGPRVAAFWIRRSFELNLYQGEQNFLTASPGWMGAVTWRPGTAVELTLNLNLAVTYVQVDGVGSARGFGGATFAGGYRF